MSEQLQVVITGKDGVSRIFQEISKSASAAGDAVEAAGKSGTQGLKQLDSTAKQTGDSVKQSGQSAREAAIDFDKFGAAAVAIGGFLTIAGNSALDQVQTIEGLKSAYGDAADEMLAFADQMAATTIFNDDDILKGERYFATLANNYDLTISQVQQLMQTTADLASAYGTSFEDASSRITAAIRGEGEAAEFLGLTMNQQAIDRENLTLTMSNQEAAAFRLNALYAQTDVYAGTAQRLVETEVGARARLTNAIQDNTQAVANFIGPYNAILAGAATGAVGIAQFAGGFTALASGIRIATTASLAFAATPVGAAVLAVGAGLAIATSAFMDHREEVKAAEEQYRSMVEAAADLSTQIGDLRLEDWGDAQWAESMRANFEREMDWQGTWLRDTMLKSFGTGDWFDELVNSMVNPADLIGATVDQAAYFWEAEANKLIDAMIPDDADRQRFSEAMGEFISLKGVVGDTTWDALQDQVGLLWDKFDAGTMTIDEVNAAIERLTKNNLQAAQGINLSTIAQNQLTSAQQEWATLGMGSVGEMTTEMTEYENKVQETAASTRDLALAERERMNQRGLVAAEGAKVIDDFWEQEKEKAREGYDEDRKRAEDRRAKALSFQALYLSLAAEREFVNSRVTGAEIILNQGIVASINEVKSAYQDMAAAREEELFGLMTSITGMDNPLDQWNASSGASPFSQIALDATNAAEVLDTVFRVVVGNTDAMANQADSVQTWIDGLMTWSDEQLNIHNLVAEGFIGQTQYNEALDAQGRITEANMHIQRDVLTMQAMQAPLIAEQTEALEDQLHTLSSMPAEQQLLALAWMDSASAARALEIATMATAVANGELGASGEAAFASYIEGLAAVDPVMKALLMDMGLIEEGADGTITVNMDGAEGAISDIDRLTEAIVGLLDYLDNGVLDESFHLKLDAQDNATPVIEAVQGKMADLDALESWSTANANDPASAILTGVQELLDNLDGDTATTNAETIDNSSSVIGSVQAALNNLSGQSATVNIFANDMASGLLGGVAGMLNALDGRTATTYVRTVNYGGGSGMAEAHGGIAGYAFGGNVVPIRAAEVGFETAHFPTGGTATLPQDGFYNVPQGTYIEPHNSARFSGGGNGITVQIAVHGNIYGIGDLAEQVTAQIVPAISEATGTRFREQGVTW